MVNERNPRNTKHRILDILQLRPGLTVSGERIASELGISRVAVWKAIRTLTERGYTILSTPAGYRLDDIPADNLDGWDLGLDDSRFRHLETTSSTMNDALRSALAGAADGYTIVAEEQIEGRGTENKRWESAAGGLFFTRIHRPNLEPKYAERQKMATQCALVLAIRATSRQHAWIGWPNDVYARSPQGTETGKAGGILAEYLVSGNQIAFINLGIGVNTGSRPAQAGAITVKSSRKDLLKAFLSISGDISPEEASLHMRWNSLCPLTGAKIRYVHRGAERTGIFEGINSEGQAVIHDTEGSWTYNPGTITIRDKTENFLL